MSGLQAAVACGALVGLGLTLVIGRLLPAHPDLKSAFERLDPVVELAAAGGAVQVSGLTDRVGIWVQRHAPAGLWARIPTRELALLRRPVHRHFGEKTLMAVTGLLFPPVFAMLVATVGLSLPFVVPVGASLVLAGLLFVVPDLTVRTEATKARREFARALASYIDLVALERASGSGSTQSLEAAAAVGDSWVFDQVSRVLNRARLSGHTPWVELKDLADQLGLPELRDLAEIMRLSREEGASVAGQLRARSTSMRSALLNEDLASANAAGEQMSVPVSVLALVFLALLGTPAILRIAFGG